MASTLIRRIQMECPLCDKTHEIEERKRIATILIKDEEVEYEETYCYCCNSHPDECEFETGRMANVNLLNARNVYRKKHNLLTSDEIIGIRECYDLSQVELAKLLGWGEATVSRYESKAIQDEAYDNMLRIVRDNPLKALEFLEKNQDKFTAPNRKRIKERISEKLDSYGKEFLSRQSLESEYVHYTEPSECNGNVLLDIDKIENVVSYFAENISNLYKVKLMKLLWYADALCFKKYGKAITGLVYRHEKMGALPVGHNRLINLENINMREEEGYDGTVYHFFKSEKCASDCVSGEELAVLDQVIDKFHTFGTREIVSYMHEETAYRKTKPGEIISFVWSKELREF